MRTFILATRNAHKVAEIRSILGLENRYLSLTDLNGGPNTVENGNSFAENAVKKAVELANWLEIHASSSQPFEFEHGTTWVLADDSGLEVDALNGAPGVYSARFAAPDANVAGNSRESDNNAKLLRLLAQVPRERRTARFKCVLALAPLDASGGEAASPVCYADACEFMVRTFEGVCEGVIAFSPAGEHGFGYDPLFVPLGQELSFAQLGEGVKNEMSHRARALRELRQALS